MLRSISSDGGGLYECVYYNGNAPIKGINLPLSSNLHNWIILSLSLSHTQNASLYRVVNPPMLFTLWFTKMKTCFHSDWLVELSVQGLSVCDSQLWILNMITGWTRRIVKLLLAINIVTRLLYEASKKWKSDENRTPWSKCVRQTLLASTVCDKYI